MKGPRPMPTHLKLLRGNPGKRRLPRGEPQPSLPPAPPPPPEHLTGYAREEWERLATELFRLKLLTVADIQVFTLYCAAYGTWRSARERFLEMQNRDPVMAGFVVKTRHGTTVQNPIFLSMRQAGNDLLRCAAEFGFSPAARSRIQTGDVEQTPGKFDGLLAG
jgi:P27 family predicted phage terminase small subunit